MEVHHDGTHSPKMSSHDEFMDTHCSLRLLFAGDDVCLRLIAPVALKDLNLNLFVENLFFMVSLFFIQITVSPKSLF